LTAVALLLQAGCSVQPVQLEGKLCGANAECEAAQVCRTGRCSIPCGATEIACGTRCCTLQQISAGDNHTCALHSGGGAFCWGSNDKGQLGDGTRQDRSQPTPVLGLDANVAQISAGSAFTCALMKDGQAVCWGDNSQGQLGDGTTVTRETAQPVQLAKATVIRAGTTHACAIIEGGAVSCWGRNAYGEAGIDTRPSFQSLLPGATVASGKPAKDIALGNFHSCALWVDGSASCWGYNNDGELGNGTIDSSAGFNFNPTSVVGMSEGAASLTAKRGHSCIVTSAGALKCWGDNFYGSLGVGDTSPRATATHIAAIPSAVFATAGEFHTCAIDSAGAVHCSGRNDLGQLGNGQSGNQLNSPVAVSALAGPAASLAAGSNHTCALLASNTLQCWGGNGSGQLGDGSSTTRLSPTSVTFP
jgi:alpha-tubulin suppressor-like RCC1 family protein